MAQSFTELVTAKALAAYWQVARNQRSPYFGESKFPIAKKLGLDLAWIKGARKAPVVLSLSAFDAKVIPLNRGDITRMATNMPFFKNSKDIDETQRQELNKLVGNSRNDAAVRIILTDIFNDKMTLIEDALLTLEVMRMQALTTGLVAISSNGQSYSYDYGVPAENKVQPKVKWDQEGSDPVQDINDWADAIEAKTGVRPTEGVMNSSDLGLLRNNTAIRAGIFNRKDITVAPNNREVLNYLRDQTEITFYINSKVYQNDDGKQTKFVADGTVVLMPGTTLGNTWLGTTPEESDLMGNAATAAKTEIVEQGIAITTKVEDDPVTVKTKVSMIALPSFELAEQVVIASVRTA